MFHFCEMTRMIQAQSASLIYFFELLTKAYKWSKEKIGDKIKNFFNDTKLKTLSKMISIKIMLKEFFKGGEIEDKKLRNHIKALDYILSILIIMTLAGIILNVYNFKFLQ